MKGIFEYGSEYLLLCRLLWQSSLKFVQMLKKLRKHMETGHPVRDTNPDRRSPRPIDRRIEYEYLYRSIGL
jgi:hypothetical protein